MAFWQVGLIILLSLSFFTQMLMSPLFMSEIKHYTKNTLIRRVVFLFLVLTPGTAVPFLLLLIIRMLYGAVKEEFEKA
jgi:hypothetical protein